jgi:hypothetical protein
VYEHLDWAARMRIIMGMAYCLQYMHHELEPPVAVYDMRSDAIFMTDDYAAKVSYLFDGVSFVFWDWEFSQGMVH